MPRRSEDSESRWSLSRSENSGEDRSKTAGPTDFDAVSRSEMPQTGPSKSTSFSRRSFSGVVIHDWNEQNG
ncbi:MAG TPA: hypothetical protein DDW52_13205 [Planctomycetaceae bacterium]|nr:hypothetical protein [Planctomycetaceae bacterium]